MVAAAAGWLALTPAVLAVLGRVITVGQRPAPTIAVAPDLPHRQLRSVPDLPA
jgi:hypothetical protein